MPWKRCPQCGGASYSAAEERDSWPCPYCGRELASQPDSAPPERVKDEQAERPMVNG
ncbi:MAG: hypothetical protein ACM3XN_08395 [Chloroflexota bacterium]